MNTSRSQREGETNAEHIQRTVGPASPKNRCCRTHGESQGMDQRRPGSAGASEGLADEYSDGAVSINEEGLGRYTIDKLKINLVAREVALVPIARYVHVLSSLSLRGGTLDHS